MPGPGRDTLNAEENILGAESSLLQAEGGVTTPETLNGFLSKLSMKRDQNRNQLRFGQPVPYGTTQNPNFPEMLNPDRTPVGVHNLPGKYFAAMPIITGGNTSQFPIGVLAQRMEQRPGYSPTEKQLEKVLKDLQEPEAYPAFNEKSSQIFNQHVMGKFNEMEEKYGVDTYRILNGMPKTKTELQDFNDFTIAIQASKNLANMSKTYGTWSEAVNKWQAEGKYVDEDTKKDIMTFTKQLPYQMSNDPGEFHQWMNKSLGNLQARMNVYDAIDKGMEGTPLMSWITQAKADGKDIEGAFSDIERTDGKYIPKQQLNALADALVTDYGYTFGGKSHDEAVGEMKKRIINRFLPSQKTSLQFEPKDGGGGTSNYSVTPIEKPINVNLPFTKQSGKAQEYSTGTVNTKAWELKANIPIQKEYKQFFDPENWNQTAPVGAKDFHIASVIEMPVHKSGPYKGKPGTQELVDKHPQLYEMKKFASGTIKSEVPVMDEKSGKPLLDNDGQPKTESKSVPRYIDYEVIKPVLDQRKIKLLDKNGEIPQGQPDAKPKEKLTW